MKYTPRTHRRRVRKWKPAFCVWLDWVGDKASVQVLLEHIVGLASSGSGSFLAAPLNDVSWDFDNVRSARKCFLKLKWACGVRFSPYVRLRLMHEYEYAKLKTLDKFQRGTARPFLDKLCVPRRKKRAS